MVGEDREEGVLGAHKVVGKTQSKAQRCEVGWGKLRGTLRTGDRERMAAISQLQKAVGK